MRKLYDIKEFAFVPPPYGGVSVYVKRLIDQLRLDGYKVGGFYVESCCDQLITSSPFYDKWCWIQTYLLPFKIWKYLKFARPYRIIHSHFSLEGMGYLWLIKVLLGKKVIVTIHNSMVTTNYPKTNVVNRFFLNMMLRSSDVLWITVSEQGKRQLMSLPVKPRTKVHVIPAYVPVAGDLYVPLDKKMQSYIDCHDRNIAFYGHSFMETDGVDIYGFKAIVKAYSVIIKRSHDSVGLVLCLSDSNNVQKIDDLHQYAKSLGVDDGIFWQIGAIDNIRTLWRNVDVYVRPTSTDGDSVAVREALDEGTFVIASDVCERPNGVMTYKYGDGDDLCDKIITNLGTPKNGKKPNYEYYEKMKKIYDSVLKMNYDV